MAFRLFSSRQRFAEYKREVQARNGRGVFPAQPAARLHGPATPPPRHRSFFRLFLEFLRLLRPHSRNLALALATLTIGTELRLLPPAGTKIVIDYVLSDKPLPAAIARWVPVAARGAQLLLLVAAAMVTLSLTAAGVQLWGRWHATLVTKRLQTGVRRRLFEHAVRLPLHRVYQLKSGGVASILREDAGGVGELVFSMLYNPWRAVLQLVSSMAVLAWVDARLLAASLVLIPLVYMTHRTWISRIRPIHRDIRSQRQEVDSQATESFGGMRVVRAFHRERSEAGRFTRGNHMMARQELHAWWWARTVEVVWDILVPLATASLLLYGGFRVLSGQLSLGDLMMFLVYLAMLLGPLEVLANSATQFQSSLAGLDRVLDLLAEPREMPDVAGAIALEPSRVAGRITLRHVTFRYPGASEEVAKDVSLDVEPGRMIALVGPSGAGKTTLCNLIARFYDPTSGAMELDGVDLRHIRLDDYRRLLGIVEQEIFLFDGTVADNIGYAVRDATQDDIRRAAAMANAHEFITELEQGYDTVIGERGVRLSGGQRQRVAIARAILADPRILILDEATSNLDTESERLIQQSLQTLMRGRTTFVIAHRLSTVTHADRIVVMDQGRVIETGTHQELLDASGRYRHMVRLQVGEEVSP